MNRLIVVIYIIAAIFMLRDIVRTLKYRIFFRRMRKLQEEKEKEPKLSKFRFSPDRNFVMDGLNITDNINPGGGYSAPFKLDYKSGVIREWWYQAFITNPSNGKSFTMSNVKGKATIYKIRDNKIYKCVTEPTDRSVPFVHYYEKEIGTVESWGPTFWKALIINDYS